MLVDPVWYRARHADVAASGADPLRHFIDIGLAERRNPNRWFDGAWYARQYADVGAIGAHPLLHYLSTGAALGRDPHPPVRRRIVRDNIRKPPAARCCSIFVSARHKAG